MLLISRITKRRLRAAIFACLLTPGMSAWSQQLPIQAGRLLPGETLVVDGGLHSPLWQRAAVHTQFFEKNPETGQQDQQTLVRVLYDSEAMYIGIDARDADPSQIRLPLVRHDNVKRTQDLLGIYLDTGGQRKSAQFFRVNAAGSTADGVHQAADDSEDLAPDFDFEVKVKPHAQGYSAVFKIPFRSLRYSDQSGREWKMMVVRRKPRKQFQLFTSVLIPNDASSLIANLQPLHNVQPPAQLNYLSIRPSLIAHANRNRNPGGAHGLDGALDIKWQPDSRWVLNATLQPDFSQVEVDVPQLSGNTRFALSIPEKRAFFYESSDLLNSPTSQLYTRSLTQPRWGVRGSLREQNVNATFYLVNDKGGAEVLLPGPYGSGSAEQPASQALAARIQGHAGALHWGTLLALKQYAHDGGNNLVYGVDTVWQLSPSLQLSAQALHSRTTALADPLGQLHKDSALDGNFVFLNLRHQGENTVSEASANWAGDHFRNDSGFVTQSGVRILNLHQGWGTRNLAGLNDFWGHLRYKQTHTIHGELVERAFAPGISLSASANTSFELQYNGWAESRTDHGRDVLRERYWSASFSTSPSNWLPQIGLDLSAGQMLDVFANQIVPGRKLNLSAQLRPANHLELEASLGAIRLQGQDYLAYREVVGRVLGIWHVSAQQNLRLIWQQQNSRRRFAADPVLNHQYQYVAPDRSKQALSLTYTWRRTPNSALYLGWGRDSNQNGMQNNEVFFKYQAEGSEIWQALRSLSGK